MRAKSSFTANDTVNMIYTVVLRFSHFFIRYFPFQMDLFALYMCVSEHMLVKLMLSSIFPQHSTMNDDKRTKRMNYMIIVVFMQ